MHLDRWMPERFALGAELDEESGEEELLLDSGIVVTNQRWAEVLRTWSCAMPPMEADDPDLIDFWSLWRAARRSHTFWLADFTDEDRTTEVKVKFNSNVQKVALGAGLYQVQSFTLIEAKEA